MQWVQGLLVQAGGATCLSAGDLTIHCWGCAGEGLASAPTWGLSSAAASQPSRPPTQTPSHSSQVVTQLGTAMAGARRHYQTGCSAGGPGATAYEPAAAQQPPRPGQQGRGSAKPSTSSAVANKAGQGGFPTAAQVRTRACGLGRAAQQVYCSGEVSRAGLAVTCTRAFLEPAAPDVPTRCILHRALVTKHAHLSQRKSSVCNLARRALPEIHARSCRSCSTLALQQNNSCRTPETLAYFLQRCT